ncbi:MAG: hypothetical protein LBF75_06790 [Treponema sp.]|jgi:hypothetical protein|nr:hypothetical protein [Treponema sp.]
MLPKPIKMSKQAVLVPLGIFMLYMILSALVIIGWQFLFPRELPPLPIYTRSWYLNQGFFAFCSLFPALAMTGLILPYGLPYNSRPGLMGPVSRLLESFRVPISTAIGATAVYGILFFLVFPPARDFQDYLRSQGQLFTVSKEKARIHAAMNAWPEVNQFITLCEQIWPNSPEIESLRVETAIHIEEWQGAQAKARREAILEYQQNFQEGTPLYTSLPEQRKPVNAAEALAMATIRLQEERYYDAHWLGLLASRIAPSGSSVYIQGTGIANQAWDALGQIEPHTQELQAYALYHQKRAGYEAMVAGDWIRAYYIFQELFNKNPGDPDVAHFLALSDQGIQEGAFFIDEIESVVGKAVTGTMFSFPLTGIQGQMVVRIPWLCTFETLSYGLDLELMALDGAGDLLYHVTVPYAKLLPIRSDSGPQLVLKMHALDRFQVARQYKPVWTGPDQSHAGDTQLILDLSYGDFLLLSKLSEGLDSLLIGELFTAVKTIGSYGYIPQVFQGEIVYRLSEPALFLPIAILSIVLAWKYRARRRSLYLVPMLVILPLICHGIVLLYRSILNTLGIWSVIYLGFPLSLGLFTFGPIVALVLSLVFLAAQPGSSGVTMNSSSQRG